MARVSGYQELLGRLKDYKRKYYQNLLIKGALLAGAIGSGAYLFVNSIEYSLQLGTPLRAVLFFGFLCLLGFTVYRWVAQPLYRLLSLDQSLTDQEAAVQIGRYFPEVKDKLLNTLQLHQLSAQDNALIGASINQKTEDISLVPFVDAIDFGQNRKYLKYLLTPLGLIILVFLLVPQLFTESTPRIINFSKSYAPAAPFSFQLNNQSLTAFKNEDFTLELAFTGNAIPQTAYVVTNDRKIKMSPTENGFNFTFTKIQENVEFEFEAAGFSSSPYEIEVVSRPNLKGFDITLDYPNYLQKQSETLQNTGNLQVPEGTQISWSFRAFAAEQLTLNFQNEEENYQLQESDNQVFEFSKQAKSSDIYELELQNTFSKNKEQIEYRIDVIQDKYPEITLDQYRDTTLFSYMIFGGNISDDYGLSRLKLFYKIDRSDDQEPNWQNLPINLKSNTRSQSYFFQWNIDSLNLQEGDKVNYYLQVWDNDGVNGAKSAKTPEFNFNLPTRQEVNEILEQQSENTKNKIDQNLQDAQELTEKIQEAEDRLKTKKNLDWQDKKLLEEIMDRKQALNEELERLKELNKNNSLQKERFNEYSENLKSKIDQLQQLMDELLDEETKRLYEELRKLLDEQQNTDSYQDLLEQLNYKEQNLEEELERTLELFKRMQFEQQLEESITDLQQLKEEQEQLSEETGDRENENQQLAEEQQKLQEQFEELQESLDELREKNQDLDNSQMFEDTSEEEEAIEQNMQQSEEQLNDNKRKPSQKSQQQATDNMEKLGQKLQQMQSGMEMEMMQENLDNLRDIEDNLVKLSFNQEELMKEFQKINQSDPRFVELSQEQLKLKDDAKVIEDSLLSLASRVFQIKSFVTREVKAMNEHMDQSLDGLKKRNQSQSLSNQQLTMTSINNLALLLGDVLQQMQQQMAQAQGGKPKPGKKNSPQMSQLQKQLNQQIEQLKKSGKTGRELSEELAKLAAQQEMIRKALQEAEQGLEELGQEGQKGNQDILEKMEETETDLVNKQITTETIQRQKEILTRLLEAEKSIRERELDKNREAEQANKTEPRIPPAFEEYLKAKEKEIELLQTVPPKLNPYYKQEVNEYFKRIDN